MTTSPATTSPRWTITAGTAFKFGFFGALGVVTLYLIVSVIFVVIGLILLAVGVIGLPTFPGIFTPR